MTIDNPSGLKEIGIRMLCDTYERTKNMDEALLECKDFLIVSTGDIPRDFTEEELEDAIMTAEKWSESK